jgi:adenylosuccinate lyase
MMKIMGYDKIVTISPFREITSEDIERVAYYETITNHDVKAIEYFLREYLSEHITLLE